MGDKESLHFESPDSTELRRIRDIVRDVVTEVAPEETVLVKGLEHLDDATVLKRLKRRSRNEPLGFGIDEIMALVTPVVWLVLEKAAEKTAETAVDGGTKRVKSLWGKNRPPKDKMMPPLTKQQSKAVHDAILVECDAHDIPADKAEALANAVVIRLVLRSDPDDPGPAVGAKA